MINFQNPELVEFWGFYGEVQTTSFCYPLEYELHERSEVEPVDFTSFVFLSSDEENRIFRELAGDVTQSQVNWLVFRLRLLALVECLWVVILRPVVFWVFQVGGLIITQVGYTLLSEYLRSRTLHFFSGQSSPRLIIPEPPRVSRLVTIRRFVVSWVVRSARPVAAVATQRFFWAILTRVFPSFGDGSASETTSDRFTTPGAGEFGTSYRIGTPNVDIIFSEDQLRRLSEAFFSNNQRHPQ